MVKVTVKGQEYYLDGILKVNLDLTKRVIKQDWDFLFVIDGIEGGGKSIFTQQVAHYVTGGNIKVEHITYSPKDFRKKVLSAPKYGAVVYDEAFRGMSARAAMTQTNRMLMGMLQEIRQKNLFIFIVLPSIWDLDKYVALHRCAGLFHITVTEKRERGFFKFYNKGQITNLLRDYKLRYKYPYSPKFKGRFTKYSPMNKEEYLLKKGEALGHYDYGEAEASQSVKALKYSKENKILIKFLQEVGVSRQEIGDRIGLSVEGIKSRITTANRQARSDLGVVECDKKVLT